MGKDHKLTTAGDILIGLVNGRLTEDQAIVQVNKLAKAKSNQERIKNLFDGIVNIFYLEEVGPRGYLINHFPNVAIACFKHLDDKLAVFKEIKKHLINVGFLQYDEALYEIIIDSLSQDDQARLETFKKDAVQKLENVCSEDELKQIQEASAVQLVDALIVADSKDPKSHLVSCIKQDNFLALSVAIDTLPEAERATILNSKLEYDYHHGTALELLRPKHCPKTTIALLKQGGCSNSELKREEETKTKRKQFLGRLAWGAGFVGIASFVIFVVLLAVNPSSVLLPVSFAFIGYMPFSFLAMYAWSESIDDSWRLDKISPINKAFDGVELTPEPAVEHSTGEMFEMGMEPGEESHSELTSECGSDSEDDYSSDVTVVSRERSDTEATGDMIPKR